MSANTETLSSNYPACVMCKHLRTDWKCAAFPKGIPDEIASGENQHNKPLKGQKNNVVFKSEFDE